MGDKQIISTYSDLKFSTETTCPISRKQCLSDDFHKKYNDETAIYNCKIKTNTSTYHDLLFVRFLFRYD
jgi:hypothetical protein